MKHTSTIIILLLVAHLGYAKGTAESVTTAGPSVGGGSFPHFTPTGGSGDAVNNTVSLRLIAKAFLTHNGFTFIPSDSTTYHYSNDRGGVPDIANFEKDDNILFTESYSYDFDNMFGNYVPATHRTQTFGQSKEVVSLIYAHWKNTTSTWRDSIRYLYTYNDGKMVTSALDRWMGNLWGNRIISSMQYNGNVVTKMNSDLYEVNFTYDLNNNLTTVSDMELTSTGWQNRERHTYEYVNKDIVKYTLQKWDVSSYTWINYAKWEYSYNGPDVETEIQYDWNGASWVVTGRHMYTYDGSHNKLVDIWQVWNGNFLNDTKTDWVYNYQNLPEKITTASWGAAGWIHTSKDFEYHYYYQTYFPDNISDRNTLAAATVKTFPIPANADLHIQFELEKAEALKYTICNMQGITVSQWEEPAARHISQSVSVADLPSGQYMLKIAGDNSQTIKPFIVAR